MGVVCEKPRDCSSASEKAKFSSVEVERFADRTRSGG